MYRSLCSVKYIKIVVSVYHCKNSTSRIVAEASPRGNGTLNFSQSTSRLFYSAGVIGTPPVTGLPSATHYCQYRARGDTRWPRYRATERQLRWTNCHKVVPFLLPCQNCILPWKKSRHGPNLLRLSISSLELIKNNSAYKSFGC